MKAIFATRSQAIEKELASASMSEALRDSKKATQAILKQRLRNLQRRSESMAEIDSDLTRIEQQVDLAVEDASLEAAAGDLCEYRSGQPSPR